MLLCERRPGKLLSNPCSPSFNWKKKLDDNTIARFQRELGAMRYKVQFITLAGFHALNTSAKWAREACRLEDPYNGRMSKRSARKAPSKNSAQGAELISIPRTHKSAPLKQLALTDDKPANGLWPSDGEVFDRTCTDCPRLAAFLEEGRKQYPDYYCAPVAPFGDRKARLIIIGLAPGFHGANATGRPFTGDYAGVLLYQTLHKFGFANKPASVHRNDGLKLIDARISNAVKCVPPDNKPLPIEITTCNHYLQAELAAAPKNVVLLALGSIGHNAVLRTLGLKASSYKFGHGAQFKLPGGQWLVDSYHCSRYNTNTRRLTEQMFEAVFAQVRELVNSG